MTTDSIRAVSGVIDVFEGARPGNDLVVIAGVHGNETCGIEAVRQLLPTLTIDAGRVTFLLGNPRAAEAGVRFVEQNLNRLFRPDSELSDTQKASYEYRRSRELMPLLESADAVLDIHSSGTKDTQPFVICDRTVTYETARSLDFRIISYGWETIEPGGTNDFVLQNGKIGIGIECGYHEDPDAVGLALEAINRFLARMGAVHAPVADKAGEQRVIRASGIHKTVTDFSPVRIFADFEPVDEGVIIGTDGNAPVLMPHDGVVIFVRNRTGSGEEACIYGVEVSAVI